MLEPVSNNPAPSASISEKWGQTAPKPPGSGTATVYQCSFYFYTIIYYFATRDSLKLCANSSYIFVNNSEPHSVNIKINNNYDGVELGDQKE